MRAKKTRQKWSVSHKAKSFPNEAMRKVGSANEGGSVVIYGLVDPRTREVAYVGKTVLPLSTRLSCHVSEASHAERPNRRCAWINGLLAEGLRPEISVIEEVTHDEWDEAEREWITFFKESGQAFANTHTGGQHGAFPGRRLSADHKAKISASLRGRKPSPSQLANLQIHNRKKDGWADQREAAREREQARREQASIRDAEIRNLREDGLTYETIAERLGTSLFTIHKVLTKEKVS